MIVALPAASPPPFAPARAQVEAILGFVDSDDAVQMSHGDLEDALAVRGRELIRRLLQDHLDLRAERQPRLEVVDAAGVRRGRVEPGHQRALTTRFGDVTVTRKAYRQPGAANLHPADAHLNLPGEQYSHGQRKLVALEAARGSFASAVAALERTTGVRIGKRQVEALAVRAAADFDAYYGARALEPTAADDVLVLSGDGKGGVMRPEALRPATRQAAAARAPKLAPRLSKGEKRSRKRMAEVGCVYSCAPVPRLPDDILRPPDDFGPAPPAPKARAKWVTASVVDDAATVIAPCFDEAERRDPDHLRSWVALVDGNAHQIDRITREAPARQMTVPIVVDFIHVLEYVWQAAGSFHGEGDPAAEAWVHANARAVLEGRASSVAAAIRGSATRRRWSPPSAPGPTPAPTTCSTCVPHWTIRARSARAGPSRPA